MKSTITTTSRVLYAAGNPGRRLMLKDSGKVLDLELRKRKEGRAHGRGGRRKMMGGGRGKGMRGNRGRRL